MAERELRNIREAMAAGRPELVVRHLATPRVVFDRPGSEGERQRAGEADRPRARRAKGNVGRNSPSSPRAGAPMVETAGRSKARAPLVCQAAAVHGWRAVQPSAPVRAVALFREPEHALREEAVPRGAGHRQSHDQGGRTRAAVQQGVPPRQLGHLARRSPKRSWTGKSWTVSW